MQMYILEKERKGFGETNSSSLHAMILNNQDEITEDDYKRLANKLRDLYYDKEQDKYIFSLDTNHETEFGWGVQTYDDIKSIINYILIDLYYYKAEYIGKTIKEELEQATADILNVSKNKVVFDIPELDDDNIIYDAYIDHQSVGTFVQSEVAKYMNKETLYRFLTGGLLISNDNM